MTLGSPSVIKKTLFVIPGVQEIPMILFFMDNFPNGGCVVKEFSKILVVQVDLYKRLLLS